MRMKTQGIVWISQCKVCSNVSQTQATIVTVGRKTVNKGIKMRETFFPCNYSFWSRENLIVFHKHLLLCLAAQQRHSSCLYRLHRVTKEVRRVQKTHAKNKPCKRQCWISSGLELVQSSLERSGRASWRKWTRAVSERMTRYSRMLGSALGVPETSRAG